MTPTEERIIYARAIADVAGQFWIAWLRQSASTQDPVIHTATAISGEIYVRCRKKLEQMGGKW